jgi:acylphosphatase
VENRSDRSVYIEAEGYRKQLDAFIEWCKEGPGIGYVESVTVDSCPPVNYSEFQIRH